MTVSRLILALGILVGCGLPFASAKQPNIILIMADDLGYRDLSSYGHPSIKTPVLDQLAADGIKLTGFHSGAAVCTPSRMALLTGSYPVRFGWTQGVAGYKMGSRDGLSPEALTMAEIFLSEGYATGISGKWHIGNAPETRPHSQGFQSTYYIPMSNNQTDKILRDDEVVEDPFENRLLTEKFTTEALRFIKENQGDPFFLYLPYSAPHFPVQPHPEWAGTSSYGKYGDVVEELDASVGRILALLDELSLAKDTIVIFTSDNGPQKGQKAGGFPFRGGKWSALEGGTRVPCIVRWTGVIPEGRESDALISAMDLLPSLCRAAGIDWEAKCEGNPIMDGVDVWGTLTGTAARHARKSLLHWHGLHAEPQALRSGDWKLFFDRRNALEGPGTDVGSPEQNEQLAPYRAALKDEGDSGPMLFDLGEDLGEVVDLSVREADKLKELEAESAKARDDLRKGKLLEIHVPSKE